MSTPKPDFSSDDNQVRHTRALGWLLVGLQFGLIAVAMTRTPLYTWWASPGPTTSGVAAVGALVLALSVGMAALWVNRPGNFNIVPAPKAQTALITQGIYRWIRHPMYTSVLLFCGALALITADVWGVVNFLVLAFVLVIKAWVEERALCEQFPSYAAYQQRTWRMLPGLW